MRRTTLLLMVLTTVLVSGCKVRNDTVVSINADRSGTLVFELSVDQELRDLLEGFGEGAVGGGSLLDGLDAQLENVPEGWVAERFVDGPFEGVRTSTTFQSLDELNALVSDLNQQAQSLGNVGSVIQFTAADIDDSLVLEGDVGDLFGVLADQLGALGATGLDPSQLPSVLEWRLIASLPGAISDDSDGEVDLETGRVIWTYRPSDTDFRIVASERSSSGVAIGLAALAAVVVAATAVALWRTRARSVEPPVGRSMLTPEEDPYGR